MSDYFLPEPVISFLSQKFNKDLKIRSVHPVSGGSVNSTAFIDTSHGKLFVKWNNATRFPGMFESESSGLEILRKTSVVMVPGIIGYGPAFLILEYIESGLSSCKTWKYLGNSLAQLHQVTNRYFGLDDDNYIGSLNQSNKYHDSWISFFITERLEKQVSLAMNNRIITSDTVKLFEKLYTKLDYLIPDEPPSLLHGDLWNGNILSGKNELAYLIDPAVYYGHREMDISMTRLFGGFGDDFYNSYQEAFPLIHGWRERVDIHNLYPLMVHVNLFGESYLHEVSSILKRFS